MNDQYLSTETYVTSKVEVLLGNYFNNRDRRKITLRLRVFSTPLKSSGISITHNLES